MSIFNKLNKLSASKSEAAAPKHPLSSESLDLRLQYLSGIALGTAVDRNPTDAERQAFIRLASSLSVDKSDAEDQLNDRASVSEDDMAVIFDAINQKKVAWLYITDLLRMHAAYQSIDKDESSVTKQLAGLLALDTTKIPALTQLVTSLTKQNQTQVQKNLLDLQINDRALADYLSVIVSPLFPYAGIISGRYIDHGNGTVTDTTTQLMWMRFCVGQRWASGKVSGSATTYSDISDGLNVPTAFNNENLAQKSDWRLPTDEELRSINIRKSSYPLIDEAAFVSVPKSYYLSSSFEVKRKSGSLWFNPHTWDASQEQGEGRSYKMFGYHDEIRSDDFVLRLCRDV